MCPGSPRLAPARRRRFPNRLKPGQDPCHAVPMGEVVPVLVVGLVVARQAAPVIRLAKATLLVMPAVLVVLAAVLVPFGRRHRF